MKIITFNINGLRSALKKGLDVFLQEHDPDIVFLQEIRVQSGDVDLSAIFPQYPYKYFSFAEKPGYSGVATLSKAPLENVYTNAPDLFLSQEGRYVIAQINENLTLVNVYLPSGTSSQMRQELKLESIRFLNQHLQTIQGDIILSGDLNLTRGDIDLKNFKGNKEKPGCTTIERNLFEELLTCNKLIDAHRHLEPDNNEIYTWWTYRGQAFSKNVGWRIDYHCLSENLQKNLQSCQVISTPRISDHGAVVLTLDIAV